MNRAAATGIQARSLDAFVRMLGRSSTGGVLHHAPGLVAAVTPAAPDRSILNSVAFRDVADLEAGYCELADRYAGAGVRAWTVWVDEADLRATELLRSRGHAFDGDPVAMSLTDLGAFPDPDPGDLDWDAEADPATVGEINALAYGLDPAEFIGAIAHPPADMGLRFYQARVEGVPASALVTCDVGRDCTIFFVATLRERRGRRLSPRLLAVALAEARERGLRTSSLQSSKLGYPVYQRLGYARDYRLTLWERRDGAPE